MNWYDSTFLCHTIPMALALWIWCFYQDKKRRDKREYSKMDDRLFHGKRKDEFELLYTRANQRNISR